MIKPEISVIIPAKDEEESIPELCQWISRVMQTHGFSYEVILIDDGSTDSTWDQIVAINGQDSRFKGLRFNRNFGKSCSSPNRFSPRPGKGGHYHGCRPSGQPRRNTRAL